MNKIKTLSELEEISKNLRKSGKSIGLITGCFDIIHNGHVEIFRFAKKNVDTLIIGLDNDQSIKNSKGEKRPIMNFEQRSDLLAEMVSIDFIFKIDVISSFESEMAEHQHKAILKTLKPNYLITDPTVDKFWENKKNRAELSGARLLTYETSHLTSSSKLMEQILQFN